MSVTNQQADAVVQRRISSTESTGERAAAISLPSGLPSNRVQVRGTADKKRCCDCRIGGVYLGTLEKQLDDW
jgi:hypothetical protein